MLFRLLLVLGIPSYTFAVTGSSAGVVSLPFCDGPCVCVVVTADNYPPGQEVFLEAYATSDLPNSNEVFLGRTRNKADNVGNFRLVLVSGRLPPTNAKWKIRYVYLMEDGKTPSVAEFSASRVNRPEK
jgi:hypothetical protein